MRFQKTLATTVHGVGTGLHTGKRIRFSLVPAPPHHGIVFVRRDCRDALIPVHWHNAVAVPYASLLKKDNHQVMTCEHLLSAIVGLSIDNLRIELDGPEVPIYDGSAMPFVRLLKEARFKVQEAEVHYLVPKYKAEFRLNGSTVRVEPADTFSVHCVIDFPDTPIKRQEFEYTGGIETYIREIASARTFGFLKDVETLKSKGLIKGGSLENAIVISEGGEMNTELRFPDEFVRHKIMDCIGDMALAGAPILARISVSKAGHAAHTNALREWLSEGGIFRRMKQAEIPHLAA